MYVIELIRSMTSSVRSISSVKSDESITNS